jgi:carbon monoxide dehydrogenase subunit G
MSLLGLGSERWFRHHVEVLVQDSSNGNAEVSWSIDLKIFGLQAGTNAIIKECQQIARQIA